MFPLKSLSIPIQATYDMFIEVHYNPSKSHNQTPMTLPVAALYLAIYIYNFPYMYSVCVIILYIYNSIYIYIHMPCIIYQVTSHEIPTFCRNTWCFFSSKVSVTTRPPRPTWASAPSAWPPWWARPGPPWARRPSGGRRSAGSAGSAASGAAERGFPRRGG